VEMPPKNLDEDPPAPDADALEGLKNGPRYPFTESPRRHIKTDVRAGVYTIWRGEELIYAGYSGRDGTKSGPAGRLSAHRSGQRSGDKFCVYVFDRFILPKLTADEIRRAAAGALNLDEIIRAFIAEELEYRYVPRDSQMAAEALERRVIRGELGSKPLLNSIRDDKGDADEAGLSF
jgi:hypothetical protein